MTGPRETAPVLMTNEFSAILTLRIFLRSRREIFFFKGQIMQTLKFSISILGTSLLSACGGSDSPHGALIESPRYE
jgi:hypothetical protein